METIKILQIIVALGLLNVWLLRFSKETDYRGKDAKNLKEEFAAYGLNPAIMYAVGGAKVTGAILLLVGVWLSIPNFVLAAAAIICLLMVGALVMHVKVKDPIKKSVPAFLMFLISAAIVVLARN